VATARIIYIKNQSDCRHWGELRPLARDIPAMAVGDWIGAEHSNQTHPSREWLSVAVSRVMLSRELRERTSSWQLSDKQVFTIVLHWIQALRNCR